MRQTLKLHQPFESLLPWALLLIGLWGCSSGMQANFALLQSDHAAAIPHLESFLDDHPEDLDARKKLGRAYLETGQAEAAAIEFNTLLEARPRDPEATLFLGMAHLQQGRLEQTIVAWERYANPRQPLVQAELRQQTFFLEKYLAGVHENAASEEDQGLEQVSTGVQTAVINALRDQERADRRHASAEAGAGQGGESQGGGESDAGGGGSAGG